MTSIAAALNRTPFAKTAFARVWSLTLFIKIILAIWLPLSNDEAYYWVWGHHPELSYFDHPPVVGWLFYLGTFFESFFNAARVPGVVLGHFTYLIWNQILIPYLDDQKRMLWLLFVVFSPLFGVGSLVITPDVPFVFFWSLSLLVFLKLLEKPSFKNHFFLGAALGAGFCSKYLAVIFVPSALIYLAASGRWRQVKWPLVPVTIVSGLLFCFPVLFWNYRNEWASFAFQLDHGLASEKRNWSWPLEYLGGQIAILFPIVVWLAIQRREQKELRFLHYFGWIPLGFFLYTSFKARVEANWPIMAHPAILTLAFLNARTPRPLQIQIGIWAFATVLVVSQVAFSWLPVGNLKTNEFNKFDVFVEDVVKARENNEPVYLGSYQMAAAISYKTKVQTYKLQGMNRRDFYDFRYESRPTQDRFFLGKEKSHSLPQWLIEAGYEIVAAKPLSDEFDFVEVRKRAQDSNR